MSTANSTASPICRLGGRNPRNTRKNSLLQPFAIALSFGVFAFASTTVQAQEVGTSVRIVNTVNASQDNRQLRRADPVFASERVSAQINSHGELRLNDNSKVLVGENSVISLDDFVVAGNQFNQGTIRVSKGAFRFITGNSSKGTFNITTPVSTIGVRGTTFDVYVDGNGETRVVLFNGEVEVCSSSNCQTINQPCDIVEVDSSSAQLAPYLRSQDRASENAQYPLVSRQGRFQFGWRAPVIRCDARAALDPDRRRIRQQPPRRQFEPGERNVPDAPDPEYDDSDLF